METDRELLRKILDNLLSNAIFFTPESGSIQIIFEEHKLYIINYGVTIAEDLLPHVFDPFVTSVNARKLNSASQVNKEAHGLGLYVVGYSPAEAWRGWRRSRRSVRSSPPIRFTSHLSKDIPN
jgi:signal transduction histidine kinase